MQKLLYEFPEDKNETKGQWRKQPVRYLTSGEVESSGALLGYSAFMNRTKKAPSQNAIKHTFRPISSTHRACMENN